MASAICFTFERQLVFLPFSLARASAGRSIPARIAMIAMTTSSSSRVNASRRTEGGTFILGEVNSLACNEYPLSAEQPDFGVNGTKKGVSRIQKALTDVGNQRNCSRFPFR